MLFANELSPMAAETYAFNLLGIDLRDPEQAAAASEKVFWLKSEYPSTACNKRLGENPQAVAELADFFCDLDSHPDLTALYSGALIVGSIVDLNEHLRINKLETLFNAADIDVDVLSGGPPCQSFSMAGLRELDNERNTLPWEFAKTAEALNPKIVLLENVPGILKAFDVGGKKHFAWFEVVKAFASINYVPLCLTVNAKYVGVAQNRPRFIMLAFRPDLFDSISKETVGMPTEHLNASAALVRQIRLGYDPDIASIRCIDIEKEPAFFSTGPLRHLFTHRHAQSFVSAKEAIDDIETTSAPSEYVEKLNSCLGRSVPPNLTIENTELRKNSLKVKARFRLYQLLNSLPGDARREIEAVIRTRDISAATSHSLKALAQAGWMLDPKGMRIDRPSQTTLKNILIALHSRKHTQKALNPDLPAPATLSIPDDACHYDERQQRTLSVREMARIQSFPDWFTFRSKATTGGSMRRFQVPQYTQVGNAVPPLLGKALARTCRELIEAL